MMKTNNFFEAFPGFEVKNETTVWYGIGSLVWGYTAEIRYIKITKRFETKYHHWEYNCEGDVVVDDERTYLADINKTFQFLLDNLPDSWVKGFA